MADELSRDEFQAVLDRLYKTIDDGFKGVHGRLDALNGRTREGEVAQENLRTRVIGLEKEVFHAPRRRASDRSEANTVAAAVGLTKRERALVTFGILVIAALFKVALIVGEFGVDIVKAVLNVKAAS